MAELKRFFNVPGLCNPTHHYMVNLDSRLAEIRKYVDRGDYFVINRARQYGKSTTLSELRKFLNEEYLVISLDFQREMSSAKFQDEERFSVAFAKAIVRFLKHTNDSPELTEGHL